MSWLAGVWNSVDGLASSSWWLKAVGAFLVVVGLTVDFRLARLRTQRDAETQRQRQESERRIANLQAQREKADAEIALAKKAAEAAIEKASDRVLTQEARDKFAKLVGLGRKGKVAIAVPMNDAEADRFGESLSALLKANGWEVTGFSMAMYDSTPHGLHICVRDKSVPSPDGAALLQRSLTEIGWPVEGNVKPTVPPGAVELIVGSK